METVHNESNLLDMRQAAKAVPHRPSPAAVWRWCRKGVRAANGERIYLEHVRFGRRLFTTRSALEAFAKAVADADCQHLSEQSLPKPARNKIRDSNRRNADAEAAMARLKEEGF